MTAQPIGDHDSPSLLTRRTVGAPAYEVKFLVDPSTALQVESWARRFLTLDVHGSPELGGGYRVSTLYLDTPELDVYRRVGSYRRTKFRLRTYGEHSTDTASNALVFLERKTKRGERVIKRRSAIRCGESEDLGRVASERRWTGHWFHRRILLRRLVPACRLTYLRTAYAGLADDVPVRVTLDRGLSGAMVSDWRSAVSGRGASIGVPVGDGRVVLEFKFLGALPAQLKEAIYSFRLAATPFSKYRACRDALGAGSLPGATPGWGRTEERCA